MNIYTKQQLRDVVMAIGTVLAQNDLRESLEDRLGIAADLVQDILCGRPIRLADEVEVG